MAAFNEPFPTLSLTRKGRSPKCTPERAYSLNVVGGQATSTQASRSNPRDRIESHTEHTDIQQTQVGFYLGGSEMPTDRLTEKL